MCRAARAFDCSNRVQLLPAAAARGLPLARRRLSRVGTRSGAGRASGWFCVDGLCAVTERLRYRELACGGMAFPEAWSRVSAGLVFFTDCDRVVSQFLTGRAGGTSECECSDGYCYGGESAAPSV